jgi:hypothetical protein
MSCGTHVLPQQSAPLQLVQLAPQKSGFCVVSTQPVLQQFCGLLHPPEPLQRHSPLVHVLLLVHAGTQLVGTQCELMHCSFALQAMAQPPQ